MQLSNLDCGGLLILLIQEMILELIWGLWSELPAHGRKAAQFVDLLGYFSLKHTETGSIEGESSVEGNR